MSLLRKNENRPSRSVFKSLSLRFKNNRPRLRKTHSMNSFRSGPDNYYNVSTDSAGRNVIADDSNSPSSPDIASESELTPRHKASTWARQKMSKIQHTLKRRKNVTFSDEAASNSDIRSEKSDKYSAAYELCSPVPDEDETGVYSFQISQQDSETSSDNITNASSGFPELAQRFFIVRWVTSKFLQFRDRRSKSHRETRSVYEKAAPIEASDSSSLSCYKEDPVYTDASLHYQESQYAKAEVDESRQSAQYFELEPESRYETVTMDEDAKPKLSLSFNLSSNQYAKLGQQEKSNGGNIYGEGSASASRP